MATEQSLLAVIRAARPSFRRRHDKTAFAIHAAFIAAGYSLNATGPPAFADDPFSVSSSDEVGLDHWNDIEDNYAFVYSNPEKGTEKVLVKCLVLNDKLLVDVLKEGASEPLHLELDTAEYVEEIEGTNYASQFKNLGKLVDNVNKSILGKLYVAPPSSVSSQPSRISSSERSIREDRDYIEPDNPYVSPYPGYVVPPVPPFGGSDTFVGPGAGMYPSRGNFGDGSMLMGPDHPIFTGGRTGEPGLPGGPLGVPPGARFDPYGPPGVPGFEPNRFQRNRPGRGGGIHPDLQHFHDDSDFI